MSTDSPVAQATTPPWKVHQCLNDGIKSTEFWVVMRDTGETGLRRYECEDKTRVRHLAHGVPHKLEERAINRAAALNQSTTRKG
jgi:hypothetical protein